MILQKKFDNKFEVMLCKDDHLLIIPIYNAEKFEICQKIELSAIRTKVINVIYHSKNSLCNKPSNLSASTSSDLIYCKLVNVSLKSHICEAFETIEKLKKHLSL